MAGPASSLYKLNYSRRRLTDDNLHHIRRELPPAKGTYPFEEVDFSQNELSSGGLSLVLEVCRRCPKLRVLKLYKNQIDDAGAEGLAELCRLCPAIEEMHLSHNHFTAVGVETLITAAEHARPNHVSPLWLRLEQNDVSDPDTVFHELSSRLSVCNRMDEVRCTVRVCAKKQKVHLPFFHLQRPNRLRDGGPSSAVQSGGAPSYRVTSFCQPAARQGPMNPPSRSMATMAKSGGTVPNGTSAWNVNAAQRMSVQNSKHSAPGSGPGPGGTPTARPGPGSTPTAVSTPTARAAPVSSPTARPAPVSSPTARPAPVSPSTTSEEAQEVAAVPAAAARGPAVLNGAALPEEQLGAEAASDEQHKPFKAEQFAGGKRASLVLDKRGLRRILPEQLEAEGSSAQFVCPLCSYVNVKPVITSCSHMFCGPCFSDYVGDQVSRQKKGGPGDGPIPVIQCPQPGCTSQLRKRDIMPMDQAADTTKVGAVQLLHRMRNNLRVRCVHHMDHYKYAFGKDAERIKAETGKTCSWIGDLASYEEHVSKGCPIECLLRSCVETDAEPSKERQENGCTPASTPPAQESQNPRSPPPAGASATETCPAAAEEAGSTAEPTSCSRSVGSGSATSAADGEARDASTVEDSIPESTRIARYDYTPDSDEAQIPLKQNDLVKIFEVTESGWAAGVRLCRKTGQELGSAGWFPAAYLYPAGHTDAAATA